MYVSTHTCICRQSLPTNKTKSLTTFFPQPLLVENYRFSGLVEKFSIINTTISTETKSGRNKEVLSFSFEKKSPAGVSCPRAKRSS